MQNPASSIKEKNQGKWQMTSLPYLQGDHMDIVPLQIWKPNYSSVVNKYLFWWIILGFLIVVQDKDESEKGSPIGQFTVSGDGVKGIKCKDENSGVSHSNPDLKSDVSIVWTKPSQFSQDSVIIRATVVYEYSRGDHVKITHKL